MFLVRFLAFYCVIFFSQLHAEDTDKQSFSWDIKRQCHTTPIYKEKDILEDVSLTSKEKIRHAQVQDQNTSLIAKLILSSIEKNSDPIASPLIIRANQSKNTNPLIEQNKHLQEEVQHKQIVKIFTALYQRKINNIIDQVSTFKDKINQNILNKSKANTLDLFQNL